MTDLGTLTAELPTSQADGINNRGQVVGFSQAIDDPNDLTPVAWLWQNGTMIDLNTVIPAGSPLFLMEAVSINDRGEIAGFGRLANGDHRPFLLTPCNEKQVYDEDCK
jgi:probable HAF family extracellular repeat protein